MSDEAATGTDVDLDIEAEDEEQEAGGHSTFDSLFYDWVIERFSRVEVAGQGQRAVWCPEWWLHPEVVDRLQALWSAQIAAEAALEGGEEGESGNPAAMSDWWLRHWDPHRAVIFDKENGPFRSCNLQKGHLHDASRTDVVEITPARPPTGMDRQP